MRPQISIEPFENQEARLIVGIDPGLSGALFFLDLDRQPTCGDAVDFPTFSLMRGGKAKREIDTHGLVILLSRPMLHAFVERASAMPGQGTTSMFSFGRTYGVVLGILAALGTPMTLVAPVQWKRALRVPAGKHASRSRASQLAPACAHQWRFAGQHGRAEAALIAIYGARQLALTTSPVSQPPEEAPGAALASRAACTQ